MYEYNPPTMTSAQVTIQSAGSPILSGRQSPAGGASRHSLLAPRPRVLGSAGPGWGPRICVSSKLPGPLRTTDCHRHPQPPSQRAPDMRIFKSSPHKRLSCAAKVETPASGRGWGWGWAGGGAEFPCPVFKPCERSSKFQEPPGRPCAKPVPSRLTWWPREACTGTRRGKPPGVGGGPWPSPGGGGAGGLAQGPLTLLQDGVWRNLFIFSRGARSPDFSVKSDF